MAKKHFTAASLFCGAGGLDLGFHKAGFETSRFLVKRSQKNR